VSLVLHFGAAGCAVGSLLQRQSPNRQGGVCQGSPLPSSRPLHVCGTPLADPWTIFRCRYCGLRTAFSCQDGTRKGKPSVPKARKERTEMEPANFDELTKALATATSRREALKTIAATTLGGILGLSGIGTVFAKPCKPNGKHCTSKTVCCSGFCDSTTRKCACQAGTCNSSCPCPSGQSCVNGSCCPTSQVCGSVCCTGTCVNGQCTCPSSCQVLANGTCAQICTGVPDSCTCGTCAGDSSQPPGFGVCSTEISDGTCTSDLDCPTGYYCNTNGGPPAHCFLACC
jgi:hypothetical protein